MSVYDDLEDGYEDEEPAAEEPQETYEEVEQDPEEAETDKRIAMVGYFRQLTRGVFHDGTEEAQWVNEELAKWAKKQVRICMGQEVAAANTSGFTQAEIDGLKRLLPLADQLQAAVKQLNNRLQVAAPAPVVAVPAPVVAGPVARPRVVTKPAKPPTKTVRPVAKSEGKTQNPLKPKKPYVKPRSGTVVPKGHRVSSRSETESLSQITSDKVNRIKNPGNVISQGLAVAQRDGFDSANATGADFQTKLTKEERQLMADEG